MRRPAELIRMCRELAGAGSTSWERTWLEYVPRIHDGTIYEAPAQNGVTWLECLEDAYMALMLLRATDA